MAHETKMIAMDMQGNPVADGASKIGQGPAREIIADFASTDAVVQHLVQHARTYWLDASDEDKAEEGRSFAPMILAICQNGDVVPVVVGGGFDDEEKDAFVSAMREQFQKWGVVRYGFMSEAWVATYDKGEDASLRPAERMNRVEVMTICAADKDGNTSFTALEMVRDATARVVDLPVYQPLAGNKSAGSQFGGRFTTLLQEVPDEDDNEQNNAAVLARLQMILNIPDAMEEILGDDFEALQAEGRAIWGRINEAVEKIGRASNTIEAQVASMAANARMMDAQGFTQKLAQAFIKRQADDKGEGHGETRH
ncbi:MAG: hypothetical protein EOP83_00575 [Verrucomicrobiaceae bacterium]|nr:MAG: hypothetical protein EOP83_00575 [Verrucomicrobiaceae bacterium]